MQCNVKVLFSNVHLLHQISQLIISFSLVPPYIFPPFFVIIVIFCNILICFFFKENSVQRRLQIVNKPSVRGALGSSKLLYILLIVCSLTKYLCSSMLSKRQLEVLWQLQKPSCSPLYPASTFFPTVTEPLTLRHVLALYVSRFCVTSIFENMYKSVQRDV